MSEPLAVLMEGLQVPTADGGSGRLSALLSRDRWQRERFDAILPALLSIMGYGQAPAKRRLWEECPRGHSKTSDLALLATWALALGRRPLRIVAAAADRDQAGLLLDAIRRVVQLNPNLDWNSRQGDRRGVLDVQQERVINRSSGATLDVISSDVASSWGLLPDLVIADELAVWPDRGEGLWESLFSAAAKRPGCAFVVITNAGHKQRWPWHVRERVRQDPAWLFRRLEGPVASWISQETLAEQQRILPPIVYNRVWLNVWAEGAGDAIPEDLLQAALTRQGPMVWEPGWEFFAGLDVGLKRDASALVVIGQHVGWQQRKERATPPLPTIYQAMLELGLIEQSEQAEEYIDHAGTGRIALALVRVWRPEPGRAVSLEVVENEIIIANQVYGLTALAADPWQAAYLIERLQAKGVTTVGVDAVPANLKAMATYTLEAFSERQIDLYGDHDLLADLRALRVVERQYGVRLESPRGASGHGDAASALSEALLAAKRFSMGRGRRINRELVCWP